jgi:hypothetical protein
MKAQDHIDLALAELEETHDLLDSERRVVLNNAIALLRSLRGTISADARRNPLEAAA